MSSRRTHAPVHRAFHSLVFVAFLLPVMVSAQTRKVDAATPSLAGPSLVMASKGAVFTGRGFAPNSAVSISLRSPAGVESHFSAVVAADGSISYRIDSKPVGTYSLKVLDTGGRVISTSNFSVVE